MAGVALAGIGRSYRYRLCSGRPHERPRPCARRPPAPPSRSREPRPRRPGTHAGATLDLRLARPVGRPPPHRRGGGLHRPRPPSRQRPSRSSSPAATCSPPPRPAPARPPPSPCPILDRLRASTPTRRFSPARHPVRALILVPTRELAIQVDESVRTYGRTVPLRSTVVYGGMPMDPQIKALRARRRDPRRDARPAARPRRPAASRTSARSRSSSSTRRTACSTWASCRTSSRSSRCCPARRQNLMFSATFSDDIRRLSGTILRDPETVEVAPRNTAAEAVRQLVYPVDRDRKEALLAHLIRKDDLRQVLVFTRTKLAAIAARLAARPRRASTRWRSTAIAHSPSGPARSRASSPATSGCSSRPTSPRAASTSRTCRSSSTSSSRGTRRTTSTGSAGPAGPARPARRSASSASTRPTCCAASSGCSSTAIPWTVEDGFVPDRNVEPRPLGDARRAMPGPAPSTTPTASRSAAGPAAGSGRRR